jgi:uncharacterized membrane protein YeaQ/YmgE (transglycosylase-associated protein family)
MHTDRQQSVLTDIIVGILGAIIGGLIVGIFGQPAPTGLNFYSLVVAVLGSIVLIWGERMLYR